MRRAKGFILALSFVGSLTLPSAVSAIPLLQLGIADGVYDVQDETTVATGLSFTLYALLTPPNGSSASAIEALLNDTYYVAAALTPRVTTPQNLGSFSFNSQTIDATADMVYGTPPFEHLDPGTQDGDSGDLANHGIYQTYFKEFGFKFKSGPGATAKQCGVNVNCATAINVEDDIGEAPTPSPSGPMYYMAFQVDTSQLNSNYQVHFDLYSEKFKNCNANMSNPGCDIDINKFAPFSHDAQSYAVPEPSTLTLLGVGVAVMAYRYRRSRARR